MLTEGELLLRYVSRAALSARAAMKNETGDHTGVCREYFRVRVGNRGLAGSLVAGAAPVSTQRSIARFCGSLKLMR